MTFENYFVIGQIDTNGTQALVIEAKAFLKTLNETPRGYPDSRFWNHEDEKLQNESFDECRHRLYQEAKTKLSDATKGRPDHEIVYSNLTVKQALLLALNSNAKKGMAKEQKDALLRQSFGSLLKGMNRVCLTIYENLSESDRAEFIRFFDHYMRDSFYRHALVYDGVILENGKEPLDPSDKVFYEHHKKWGYR